MAEHVRTVLHVLPHPGGGGETYVEALAAMEGYAFERLYLARTARPSGALVGGVTRALREARRHDLVHVHGEVAAGLCLPLLVLRPSVVTLHGLHLARRLTGTRRRAAELNLRIVLEAARRTICVSGAEREEVLDIVGERLGSRVITVRNGVAPLPACDRSERAAARAALGLTEQRLVGVWLGSLEAHKDPLVAIRAAQEVAASGGVLTLLVAGDGSLQPEVERLADGSDGAVRALGFRGDGRKLLGAADFFVSSSLREGLSYALLEAMSLGLPPVVSDAPGNPEAVGDCGLVVPRGDVAALASAYRRLLGDAEERRALGARARERVQRHFDVDSMVRRTRAVYDEVVARYPA